MATLRYILFVILAAAVTLGAFFLMHKLIDGPALEMVSDEPVPRIRFVALDLSMVDPPPPPRTLPERPEPPEQPPPPPVPETVPIDSVEAPLERLDTALTRGPGVPIRQGARHPPSSQDGPAVLLNALPPPYPRDAAVNNQEGWVKVAFVVTRTGTVRDVRVLDAQPRRVFEQAAVNAVQRWTFRPRIENGAPVEQELVQIVEFTLEAAR